MKLRIVLILVMVVTLLSLSSCITSREMHVEVSCEQFVKNSRAMSEFQAEVGDKITVKLCSNPSTGFEWEYEMSGDNALKEEDYDFEEPKSDVPGAAGIEVWTFETVENGVTEVRMEYNQPWEGGEKEEWTYTMTVKVE